jgi:hypothetical protein
VNIVIPPSFRQIRAAVPFDRVSLGYTTVHLHPFAELSAAQQGYGIVPEGDETDWDPAWVVIGYEDCTGDPIFIDTDDEDFPVYTAAHGMGEWSAHLIAFSFRHLIDILEQVRRIARGRETPVALERNPIPEAEREEVLSFIRRNNPDISMTFWEVWLQPPE